jgi:hypothetical protein
MFVHIAVAWLLLAGFVLLVFFAVTLTHYILICPGQRNGLHKSRRRRISGYFIAAGLAFMQLISELYSPGTAFALQEIRDEDADEDDDGDPESLEKQLNNQLRRIRRGEDVGDLVLRL